MMRTWKLRRGWGREGIGSERFREVLLLVLERSKLKCRRTKYINEEWEKDQVSIRRGWAEERELVQRGSDGNGIGIGIGQGN